MFGKANMSTGMPQLTITNHSELYPEVLNSLNKMLLMKCQSQLHNKIRKHAMKQASRNRSVFPRSSANFLSRGLLSCPRHKSAFKKVMSKLNEQLHDCVAYCICNNKFRNTKALALHYRVSTVLFEAHD